MKESINRDLWKQECAGKKVYNTAAYDNFAKSRDEINTKEKGHTRRLFCVHYSMFVVGKGELQLKQFIVAHDYNQVEYFMISERSEGKILNIEPIADEVGEDLIIIH